MAIIDDIQTIVDWVKARVCNPKEMKRPKDDAAADSYEYELVTPAVFSTVIPTRERQPLDVTTAPSALVSLGESALHRGITEFSVRIQLAVWNPGDHAQDIFIPKDGGTRFNHSDRDFQRTARGWMDALNWAEFAAREVYATSAIRNLRIKDEDPIEYGLLGAKGDEVMTYYPYFFSFVEFGCERIMPANRRVDAFL